MKAGTLGSILAAALIAAMTPLPAEASGNGQDSTIVLQGGSEGTVFKRMTIEGEDRFRIDFERPELMIALDPAAAPGLDWDNTWDVLAEGAVDLRSPLTGLSACASSPYLPRPWLSGFRSGDIVRFQPALTGVERWRMTIADPRGGEVRSFESKGDPPDLIGWDGLSQAGVPMPPGYTYSYVVEAWDRAGNRRNFVGKGFGLPAYMVETGSSMQFLFPAGELSGTMTGRGSKESALSPLVLEAASRMNQRMTANRHVLVTVTARSFEQADAIAASVTESLESLLIGDPALIQRVTDVRAEAPETGTVAIVSGDGAADKAAGK